MKTIWEWLEIEPTKDKNKIKHAYASQVKKYHPEEKPQEAQELRRAYKQALMQASSGAEKTKTFVSEWMAVAQKQQKPVITKQEPELPEEEAESPEYAYDLQKRESPEEEAESPEYTYDLQKREWPEEEAESPEYTYDLQKRERPEEEAESPEYTYDLQKRERPEEEAENPEYKYHIEKIAETQKPTQKYNYDLENKLLLDAGTQQRFDAFGKLMDIIYGNVHMRNDVQAWRILFQEYQTKQDFYNPAFVGKIMEKLSGMKLLAPDVWYFLEERLFPPELWGAGWEQMRAFLKNMQAQSPLQNRNQTTYTALTPKEIVINLYGPWGPQYKKYNKNYGGQMIVAVIVLIMLWAGFSAVRNAVVGKPEPHTISYDPIIYTNGSIEDKTYDKSELYKSIYKKSTPYKVDLNGDGIQDIVYYDEDQLNFVIEHYNPETKEFEYQGNLTDYYIAHPETFEKLKGFMTRMSDSMEEK